MRLVLGQGSLRLRRNSETLKYHDNVNRIKGRMLANDIADMARYCFTHKSIQANFSPLVQCWLNVYLAPPPPPIMSTLMNLTKRRTTIIQW